jgi:hypothetical protein
MSSIWSLITSPSRLSRGGVCSGPLFSNRIGRARSRWARGALLGVAVLLTAPTVPAATLLVRAGNPRPAAPYDTWASAARTLQEAVEAAQPGDTVLVTNGLYALGGRAVFGELTNRVLIDKAITVQSVNGPAVTVIKGAAAPDTSNGSGATRCAYVGAGAVLSGFTLTDGHTLNLYSEEEGAGGGVFCEESGVVSDCVLFGNTAFYGGGGAFGGLLLGCTLLGNEAEAFGGGALRAELHDCLLMDNTSGSEGGGAYASTLLDCMVEGNSALYGGGAGNASVVTRCALTGNQAQYDGGGAYSSTLSDCLLEANSSASQGGGAGSGCLLSNCTVTGNASFYVGGGAHSSTLQNCTLEANSAEYGGGAYGSTLLNCTLRGNQARDGAGACYGGLRNSVLAGNSASRNGGGVFGSTLFNCTLTGNFARTRGGGMDSGYLYNCIAYYNTAHLYPNHVDGYVAFSCTTPLPEYQAGNISSEPELVSATHLGATSPCIASGSSSYASGADIDGDAWTNPPSMGADQYVTGGAVGPLTVAIDVDFTEVTVGFAVKLQARLEGHPALIRWDFGDGTTAINQPYVISHAWSLPAEYDVRLTAYNETHPAGVSATLRVRVVAKQVYYVDRSNPTPMLPYNTWQTAAVNIQDAIDAGSVPGRQVLVADGLYDLGGTAAPGSQLLNRVTLSDGVEVHSVNGPSATVIYGQPAPGGGHGDGAVRCAFLGNGSRLSGFTLTNGHTRVSGATGLEQSGGGAWCQTAEVLTNCILTGNAAARDGGGVDGGTLYRCALLGNVAGDDSGGADESTLYDCVLAGNSSSNNAGGADSSALYNCTLSGNSAQYGGAVEDSELYNCQLLDNVASTSGGGAGESTLHNCVVSGNRAAMHGGGADSSVLFNCTVTGNAAVEQGGGTAGGQAFNSILFFNTAPNEPNYSDTYLTYSCTAPLPNNGYANLALDPQLASISHLSAHSPCIGAGSAASASGVDIDGEPWQSPPCIGADQFVAGAATGPLSVAIKVDYAEVAVGYAVSFRGLIEGQATDSVWSFGDGVVVSNRPYVSPHAWGSPGYYVVRLTAYNESHPGGIQATVTLHVVEEVYYVNASNAIPKSPFSSWVSAATSIQDAIDAGSIPGRLVLVTNGVYETGGLALQGSLLTNRIVLTNAVRVRSVNGPLVTTLCGASDGADTNGLGSVRCAYLASGAVLDGFTLTNGHTLRASQVDQDRRGGGAWCEEGSMLTNCILTRNWAAEDGGGVCQGTLYGCLLVGNSAQDDGGGARQSTLHGCLLASNTTVRSGGGAYQSTLLDCVLTNNSALYGAGARDCVLSNCTLAGNAASNIGGGAYESTLYSCLLTRNTANRGGGAYGGTLYHCRILDNRVPHDGGGVDGATLYNCLLVGNHASDDGGAADDSRLYNCTVTGNSASNHGGGTDESSLYNCIVYYNTSGSPSYANFNKSSLSYCCTRPSPGGAGNITNEPAFLDAAAGDYRLRYGSACIDAGTAYISSLAPDLAGQPRWLDGNGDGVVSIDMGAYEFDLRTVMPTAWFLAYGLDPTDPQVVSEDPDLDGSTTYQEWVAETDPTNSLSCLRIEAAVDAAAVTVRFDSSSNRLYTLLACTNLPGGAWTKVPGQADLPGSGGMQTLQDTNAGPWRFYRVSVRAP